MVRISHFLYSGWRRGSFNVYRDDEHHLHSYVHLRDIFKEKKHAYIYIYIYAHTHTLDIEKNIYAYIHTHIYIYIYIYIHTHTHTHRVASIKFTMMLRKSPNVK